MFTYRIRGGGKSLKNRLVLTYLILTLLFVCLITCVSLNMMHQFSKREYANYGMNSVEQLQRGMDEQFLLMYEISEGMQANERLNSSAILTSGSLLNSNKAFFSYNISIDYVRASFLFYSNEEVEWVYSDRGVYNRNYFDRTHVEYAVTLADLQEAVLFNERQALYPLPGNTRYLINACQLTRDPYSRRTLVFLVDTDEIYNRVFQLMGDELCFVKLTGSNGRELFSRGDEQEAAYLFSFPTASDVSMQLTVGVQSPSAFRVMDVYRKIVTLYIALSVVLGIWLSGFFSHKIYTPISDARKRILTGSSADLDDGAQFGEMRDIESVVCNISNEKERLAKLVNQQSSALKVNYLSALLSGTMIGKSKTGFQIENNEEERFCLVLAMLDHAAEYRRAYDAENRRAIEKEIAAIIGQLGNEFPAVAVTDMNEKMQLLALVTLEGDEDRKKMPEVCRRIQKEVMKSTEQTITLAVGAAFEGEEDVEEYYLDVYSLAQRRLFRGWNALLDAEKEKGVLSAWSAPELDYPALKNACVTGSREAAQKEIAPYIEALRQCKAVDGFRLFYCALLTALRQIAAETLNRQSNMLAADEEPETIEQAIEIIQRMMERIVDCLAEEKNYKRTNVAHEVMDYLEAHYMDAMLSVDDMVKYFGISRSYLLQCFKETYEMSVSTALDQIRMKNARTLLACSDQKVKDIVGLTGYVDVNNFIRKFKKIEGITPLQFRKISCGERADE